MSIKSKLIALLCIPLLGIAILGFQSIRDSSRTSSEMSQLQILSQLAVRSSALVHETQKERGATAGFLGSKGARFGKKLAAQRKLTDERLADLNSFLASFDAKPFSQEFQSYLGKALDGAGELTAKRAAVDAQTIPLGGALGYYTGMNTNFLNTIGTITAISSNAELTIQLTAYVNFLKGKERAGIERAVLSNTFVKDKFGPGMYSKFISLVTQQDTYFGEYRLIARPENIAFFDEQLRDPAVAEVVRYRGVASSKAFEGGFGEDAIVWFDTITKKINRLKAIEDHLSENLKLRVSEEKTAATWHFLFTGTLTVIAFAIAAVGGTLVVRSIIVASRAISTPMADVADGNLTIRLEARNDEIGDVTRAVNTVLESMQTAIQKLCRNADTLGIASNELTSSATQMATGAQEATCQSAAAANATKDISVNMSNVADSTDQMSTNVQTVSSAVEEMTATISEIAQNAEKSATVARDAVKLADISNEKVGELGDAADEIGKVIEVIQDIAEQTNLLALNHTFP